MTTYCKTNAELDAIALANHRTYDAFGNLVHETNATIDLLFGYTGRLWDEATQLQYNLNRWYDPVTGRWISEDPIGFTAGDPNLYRYVNNEATGAIDPTGLVTVVVPRIGLRVTPRVPLRGARPLVMPKPSSPKTSPDNGRKPPGDPPATQNNEEENFDPCKGKLRYVPSPKHPPAHRLKGLGRVSPAPTDGAGTIEVSIPVKGTSSVRVGIDPNTKEFVVFRETHRGTCIYHGYQQTWDQLTSEMQNALKKAGKVTTKGKVIEGGTPPQGGNAPGILDKLWDIWDRITDPPPNPADETA